MKILWIINTPFGLHFDLLGKACNHSSGGWYNVAYEALKDSPLIQLHIVALGRTNKIISKSDTFGNHFYILPGNYTRNDINFDSKTNQNLWKEIINIVNPHIVQLWGTEFQHGLCAIQQIHNIPILVYMQGVMSEIAYYLKAGIDDKTIRKHQTLRSILLKRDSIFKQQRLYNQMSNTELNILKLAKNVIVENDWCEGICKANTGKDLNIYKSKLPINPIFHQYQWKSQDIEPHTIFTNAGGSIIKGHHILFKALKIVIKEYPDVKVRIPGGDNIAILRNGFKNFIKRDDYSNYLRKLIISNNLENNIEWVGKMHQTEMAELIKRSNVYVMPSAIENHSSSLIEAMIIGIPSISSYVGGVTDFAIHNSNCLLYRFDDYKSLAANIIKLFQNPDLCNKLSKGSQIIREKRSISNIKTEFISIYNSLYSNN